jgi:hypothetical protein
MSFREKAQVVQGVIVPSDPTAGSICVADSGVSYVLIEKSDIVSISQLDQHLSEVRVLSDAEIWRTSKVDGGRTKPLFAIQPGKIRVDEENLPPPFSFRAPGDPDKGGASDQAKLKKGVTIEGAAKIFDDVCKGGGSYKNNCAHFLSNAFMNAGFTDFDSTHECIDARCDIKSDDQLAECKFASKYKYRVIRAKELRCWFKKKATTEASAVKKNSGFWAAYQERPSDGQGHVAILDTHTWLFYGTGWYSKGQGWMQEFYQW